MKEKKEGRACVLFPDQSELLFYQEALFLFGFTHMLGHSVRDSEGVLHFKTFPSSLTPVKICIFSLTNACRLNNSSGHIS